MVDKSKKNKDYDPIIIDKDIEEDSPPDDLSSVFVKFFSKFNIITSIFIFLLYMLVSTDGFQLHIMRELNPSTYDPKIDSITETGIIFNGIIISLSYMIFDFYYNDN